MVRQLLGLSQFTLTTILFTIFISSSVTAETGKSLEQLRAEGDIQSARTTLVTALNKAQSSKNKASTWNALMRIAWFETEVSQNRKAIEYSNQALSVASALGNEFMIGRSLCWLGWSYSYLGLYELAAQFFENAIEVGTPKNVPKIIPVWGLATQELGALHFKMGNTDKALELLNETYKFATKNNVLPGIAEGGAHLAEIYFAQGKYPKARQYAEKAQKAAETSNCSQFIIAQARTIQIKISIEEIENDDSSIATITQEINDNLDFCTSKGLTRCIAESKLALAKILNKDDAEKKYQLVTSALELLVGSESELRGSAEAQLGRVFIERNEIKLAEFYLSNGIKLNAELFRKIDDAHLNFSLALIAKAKADENAEIDALRSTIDSAKNLKAFPQLLKAQDELSHLLIEHGYFSAARDVVVEQLQIIEELMSTDEVNSEFSFNQRYSLNRKRVELAELIIRLGTQLESSDGYSMIN